MLETSLNSGFTLGTWPGTAGTSAQGSPQGPTAATAGFGTSASTDGGGTDPLTSGVLAVGGLALAGLFFLWWSLPR